MRKQKEAKMDCKQIEAELTKALNEKVDKDVEAIVWLEKVGKWRKEVHNGL